MHVKELACVQDHENTPEDDECTTAYDASWRCTTLVGLPARASQDKKCVYVSVVNRAVHSGCTLPLECHKMTNIWEPVITMMQCTTLNGACSVCGIAHPLKV